MARKDKVQVAIKKEVSAIIRDDLSDPRIGFVTVTSVDLSPDLKYAKIFISVLGEPKQRKETFKALASAKGYVRKLLGDRLNLRFVPNVSFKEDTSAAYSVYIAKKIDEIKEETNQE